MLWTHKNIQARIWSNDHCPPHVTFICDADGWTARVEFSMVSNVVSLKDIKPLVNAPSMALINALMNQTVVRLRLCRSEWWRIQGTVCLDNQAVARVSAGKVRLGKAPAPVGTIVAKSGTLEANKVVVQVKWSDGDVSNETVTG